jgi:predicted NodU family carbamoyl transferase
MHVDGNACPHAVDRDANSLYWQAIHEFDKHTGVSVIMKTSLNLLGVARRSRAGPRVQLVWSSSQDALVMIGSLA